MKDTEKQIFERLEHLYSEMDRAWETTASLYGFKCNGCDENCCETEFHHHTLIEKAYLIKGFNQLPPPAAVGVKKRTKKVQTKRNIAAKKGESIRIMCPLNQGGKCILYKFRPMICRLHGIPHELRKPGCLPVLSPGCKAGSNLFNAAGYIQFDRTPFYIEMAKIEKEYQGLMDNKVIRNRETIAQILVK